MTRHITKLLLSASALTVLAVAPAASAAPVTDTKLYSAKKTAKIVKVAERGDRSDRNRGQRSDRNRSNRSRTDRNQGDRSRSNAGRNQSSNRHRSDRNRGNSHVRTQSRGHENVRSRQRSNRNYYSQPNRSIRRNVGRTVNNRGYRTSYRSNLGISFNFGSPGYSRYRWAPAAYSFYRPTYGSYGYYQRSTVCHRINVEGWHHGQRALISVKECSNPWDGAYIVQGSERLLQTYW